MNFASEVVGSDFASLRSARPGRQLEQLCLYAKVSQLSAQLRSVSLTLTASPAQPNPTTSNGETLHLFDRSLSVRLTDKLNEATIFPGRNLDL